MRSFVLAILCCVLAASCKPSSSPKSESTVLADATPGACACNDLECWDRQTNAGVSGQLSCVKDALGAAANLATAGGVAYAKVLLGASQLYSISLATFNVWNDASPVNIVGLIQAIISGDSTALRLVFGVDYAKTPGLACFLDARDSLNSFLQITKNIMAVSNVTDDAQAVLTALGTLGSAASGVVSNVKVLDACAQLIRANGPSKEIAESLTKLTNAWSNIMNGYSTVLAFANCGWQIGKGGMVLIGNTMCLLDDLDKLAMSSTALQNQRIATLNRPAANVGTSAATKCNDEPNDCNVFAMSKLGLWLGQQTYFSYLTRSYLCADMCGNNGAGGGECQKNADAIFQSDVDACKPVCGVAQCQRAIDTCVSFCCDQDASCADAAHQKMREYHR